MTDRPIPTKRALARMSKAELASALERALGEQDRLRQALERQGAMLKRRPLSERGAVRERLEAAARAVEEEREKTVDALEREETANVKAGALTIELAEERAAGARKIAELEAKHEREHAALRGENTGLERALEILSDALSER